MDSCLLVRFTVSRKVLLKLWILSDILLGFLGLGISPLQGPYLHRTEGHTKAHTYTHVSSGIRTGDVSVREVQEHKFLRPCRNVFFSVHLLHT